MKHTTLLLFLAMLAVALSGCGDSAKVVATAPDSLTAPDADALMDAARQTLSRMLFVIDKYDIEAGYIRTRPQRGAQFFEPWRQDNASAAAFARANIDSLRRTVEVFVEPLEGTMQLRCLVSVQKLALPPQPIQSMARLANMYTDSSRNLQTLAIEKEQLSRMEWLDLGPDHALEHRIVTQIQEQLGKG